MPSQSARATSAAEARFRVPYPNSRPRATRLLALDRASQPLVAQLAEAHPGRFVLALGAADDHLAGASERARALIATLDATDLVVMVASGGEDDPAASIIAEACRLRQVPVVVFVRDAPDRPPAELTRTLAHLRPYATMLVRAASADYVADMLAALRA